MEKLLSIIIPTYNMENYLPKCLDSLILEDHLMAQLDIIVVNDGSKDASSEIAHRYEERFPNSITVIDKQNGNYGSCINAGLAIATGKYIRILDSDDSYDNKNFHEFVAQLATLNADLVLTNFTIVNEAGCDIAVRKCSIEANKEYHLKDYTGNRISMHAITYKREVFNGLDYHQTEGVSYTDTEWMIIPMMHVDTMLYLDLNIYRYLLGREGQTVEFKTFLRKSPELITVIKNILVKTSLENQEQTEYIHKSIYQTLAYLYRRVLLYGDRKVLKVLEEFDTLLQQHYLDYYADLNQVAFKGISYKYIRHWRQNKFLSSLARKIKKSINLLKGKR